MYDQQFCVLYMHSKNQYVSVLCLMKREIAAMKLFNASVYTYTSSHTNTEQESCSFQRIDEVLYTSWQSAGFCCCCWSTQWLSVITSTINKTNRMHIAEANLIRLISIDYHLFIVPPPLTTTFWLRCSFFIWSRLNGNANFPLQTKGIFEHETAITL